MTKIKMCGLFRDEDIAYVNEIKPEYIGFVFYKKSHRYVDFETAKRLRSKLDNNIKAVGVFVNEDISFIKDLVKDNVIDVIQLHGNEDSEYIARLKDDEIVKSTPVIKAIQIKDDSVSPEKLFSEFEPLVDFFLLDSGMGSGSSFDWKLVKEPAKPFFLAGGLSNENIEEAIKTVNPYAVDVSSGIETSKVKDFDKMKHFAHLVRR